MKRLFDPDAIRVQIANLKTDRERLDQAIHALESALRNIESIEGQVELPFAASVNPGLTLQGAVKENCLRMKDNITRQRVLIAIERRYPFLQPNSSSVSAALINLSKGDNAMLNVAAEGSGRSPTVYSTQGNTVTQLNSDEIAGLMEPINGVGGWQSLWTTIQKQFDKSKGEITMEPALRARIHHYFQSYGVGGFQSRTKRVFRRTHPHLFEL
jgi:hypothetical protein